MNVIDKSLHNVDTPGPSSTGDSDTSVDKMFMIGCVKKIPENHHNMKELLGEIDISSLQCKCTYTYCGDQKIINVVCGIKNHASNYPCPYCIALKKFLEKEKAPLRTLDMLSTDLGKKDGKKDIHSVENPCLLIGKPEDTILKLFPPPFLHLMLRCTNTVCDNLSKDWKEATPELTEDPVIEFAKANHIVRMSYHGGGYEGNQCSKMLQKAELLAQQVPDHLTIYTDCLAAFRDVKDSVAGWKVKPNYAEKIQNFKEKYSELPISITPSVHSALEHILDWFEINGTEYGLALYSEQATESCHNNFLSTVWEEGNKVPDTHPKYAENLLNAVAKYNSRHVL